MPRVAKPASDVSRRIVGAAMKLAAERPWNRLGLAEIAAEAGLPLLELYRTVRSRHGILLVLARQIDAAVLEAPADASERPRDRLFDILMRRFDALTPYKPGLAGMTRSVGSLGLDGLALALRLPRSMAWMLEAAGIPASGAVGALRAKVLGAAYLSTMRTFLDDDTPDLARTMAALDRSLRRVEPLLRLGSFAAAPPRPETGPSAEGAAPV